MGKFLKTTRVVIAAFIFCVITCGFLNLSGGNPLSQVILRTQFTPALISAFTGCAAALVILMVLTLLFGRVYCSFLCPLGIFQDIVIRISNFARRKAGSGRRPKMKYSKPHNVLRYSILVLSGISLVFMFTYPLALLDPYSNYGRIVRHVFGTVEMSMTNLLSGIFPATFYTQQYVSIGTFAFVYSLAFLVVIVIFSAARGRLYCNTLCPVGTFLGAVGGLSLFKPVIDKEKCMKCGLCAGNCKSSCINLETKEIDATRCVACYNCLTSCKRGGVKLLPTWLRKRKSDDPYHRDLENPERRTALIAIGGLAAAAAAKHIGSKASGYGKANSGENTPIMPPGARNLQAFKDSCTACHACIAACPNKIIKPAYLEYGIDGIMLPTIKYEKKYCSFGCNTCSHTCPHGALEHISPEQKQKTQIALATYDPSTCVVVEDGVKCGACAGSCPAGAIGMRENPVVAGQFLPKIDPLKCIGCGACEYACPAMPKAISVTGKAIQTRI